MRYPTFPYLPPNWHINAGIQGPKQLLCTLFLHYSDSCCGHNSDRRGQYLGVGVQAWEIQSQRSQAGSPRAGMQAEAKQKVQAGAGNQGQEPISEAKLERESRARYTGTN